MGIWKVGGICIAIRSWFGHGCGFGCQCTDTGIEHGVLHSFGSIDLMMFATEKIVLQYDTTANTIFLILHLTP